MTYYRVWSFGCKLEFDVIGMPAPQGSKKFVGMVNGHGLMVESSKKVRPWRQDVKAAARAVIERIEGSDFSPLALNTEPGGGNAVPIFPLDGPLIVRMVFTLPKPASAPKRKRTYPDKKPDLSKLVRSTEDALTDAGIWRDDARVIEYTRLAKVFPGEDLEALPAPGVRLTIMQAHPSP